MLERAGIILFALPALIWFPMGFSLVIVSADQLLFGFDDMPLGLTVFSFVAGIGIAFYSMWVIGRGVWRGSLRRPVFITVSAVVFGAISLPAARLMTRVEQERRYAADLQIKSIRQSGTYQNN
jgi:hypothetical protein